MCDEPHPLLIKEMIGHCADSKIDEAYQILKSLWDKGYSPHDIITNIFRVCKNHAMPEYLKLEFIKVGYYTHVVRSIFNMLCYFYTHIGNRLHSHEDH